MFVIMKGISLFMFAPQFPELKMNKNRARAVYHENAILMCAKDGADFTVVGGGCRDGDRCGDSVDFLSMTLLKELIGKVNLKP